MALSPLPQAGGPGSLSKENVGQPEASNTTSASRATRAQCSKDPGALSV